MLAEHESALPHTTSGEIAMEEIFEYAKSLNYGELHFKLDPSIGLFSIVAIHNTKLGPALGGCRFKEYSNVSEAMRDAMRLAQGMSYKAAMCDLPLGGGKSVIMKLPQTTNREAIFEKFGQFIEELGGRYITAVDSGTKTTDMDIIARKTAHVTSTSAGDGDPSPFTAVGVIRAMEAAMQHKLGKVDFAGKHIVIQGVGNVGHYLVKDLSEKGAKITITDTNQEMVKYCVDNYRVNVVEPDQIYDVPCDIFAPCALGAVINDLTIAKFQTGMIVGAANNQLAEPQHGVMLAQRGILFAPDYIANGGGLIHAAAQYFKIPIEVVNNRVATIYDTTLTIFERAAKEKQATNLIADMMAQEKIA